MTSASQFLTNESITEFADSIVQTGRSKATAKAYKADLREFQNYLVGRAVGSKNNPEDRIRMLSETWLAVSAQSSAPATVRRRKATVSRYLAFLGLSNAINYRLPAAPPPNPTPVPGGMAGVTMMLAQCFTRDETLLIAFGGFMGLRVSESISVQFSDVDWDARTILIKGKGSKFRRLPMPDSVANLITSMSQVRDRPSLDVPILDIGNSTARRMVHEIALRTFLDEGSGRASEVSSHDLRATFATDMYRRTKDIAVVQKWLGHSSPETTQRYVQVDLAEMRLAMAANPWSVAK